MVFEAQIFVMVAGFTATIPTASCPNLALQGATVVVKRLPCLPCTPTFQVRIPLKVLSYWMKCLWMSYKKRGARGGTFRRNYFIYFIRKRFEEQTLRVKTSLHLGDEKWVQKSFWKIESKPSFLSERMFWPFQVSFRMTLGKQKLTLHWWMELLGIPKKSQEQYINPKVKQIRMSQWMKCRYVIFWRYSI